MFLTYFFSLLPLVFCGYYNFKKAYKAIETYYECDENCYFDQEFITMKTISKWPKDCQVVCGVIHLNQDSDVPEDKLKEVFGKLWILKGAVRVENSQYTNLAFLPELYINCEIVETQITNNSLLTNIDPILNWQMAEENYCSYRVSGNPKLDTRKFCESSENYEKTITWMVFDNLKDCGCTGGKIDWRNPNQFQNCENITGKVVISDLKNEIPNFAKLKFINGYLEVKNTNLKNMSLFGSLEKIVSSYLYPNTMFFINLRNNERMTRFGMKALKNLTNVLWSPYMLSFEKLHPEFCLTVEEFSSFLDQDLRFLFLDAKFCPEITWSSEKPKLCIFQNMTILETDCVYIYGDLLIDSGDEGFVRKLKDVRRVFGTITMRNTNLENCYFLSKLERIVRLNGDFEAPLMRFLNNKNLKDLQFPNVATFWANGEKKVIVEGNHPDVFTRTRHCLVFQHLTETNVTYNRRNCISINKTLPGEAGFDFYNGVDYEQYTDKDKWWDEYDGDFYFINPEAFDHTFDILDNVNTVISIVGFLINIVNLIVLFQRELRTIFIFILMIGISFCEILLVSVFIIKFLFDNSFIYTKNKCNDHTYYHILFDMLRSSILSMARRCSSFLAVLMAVFRTLTVMFPLNMTVVKMSKPIPAVIMVLVLFLVCVVWDFLLVTKCEIYDTGYRMFNDEQVGFTPYNFTCPTDNKYDEYSAPIYKILGLLDGFSTVITAILYLTVTIALLYHLRIAKKMRKSLNNEKLEKSDNTLMLVTVMSITFFVSEMLYGASYIIDELVLGHYDRLKELSENARIVVWTSLIINSTVHCFICFFMSSQYKKVARRLFCWRKKEKSSLMVMASISGTKNSGTGTVSLKSAR